MTPIPPKAVEGLSATPFGLPAEAAHRKPSLRMRPLPMRDIAKISTYAVMHFCVSVAVAYALTGDLKIALSIGVVEPLIQTAAYALHERGWARRTAFASRGSHDRH